MTDTATTARIRTLNDQARTALGVACLLVQTDGINALPPAVQSRIREQVETFDAFTTDNDPYQEHDFGSFEDDDAGRVFWKLDYYDPTLTRHSDDPASTGHTRRVLTIMLAAEY